jgi:hypothetical protein
MLFLFSEVGTRPVAIYLLARCVVNILSINANVADNANNVNNVNDADNVNNANNVGDTNDADDADLAKTLLLTLAVFFFCNTVKERKQ